MADTQSPEIQPAQDLGLGGKLADRSQSRLLNPDGTFNVKRNDRHPFHPINLYHTFLFMPLVQLLGLTLGIYLLANLVFAGLYYLCGPGAIDGAAQAGWTRFEDCFFFSVQTIATIGYGRMVPVSRAANLLVAGEALVGLLAFATISALLYSRFSRPRSRMDFSRRALIAPYQDGWALMLRTANLRRHNLTAVRAVVSYGRWETEAGRRQRKFELLKLERSEVIFLPTHWVLVHPIGEDSPLRGETPESLAAKNPEFFVLVTSDDETYAQTVHARTSYTWAELVWGARFVDMYLKDEAAVAIDLKLLHEYEIVPPPERL
jgi:inward rectifier potassium channel